MERDVLHFAFIDDKILKNYLEISIEKMRKLKEIKIKPVKYELQRRTYLRYEFVRIHKHFDL